MQFSLCIGALLALLTLSVSGTNAPRNPNSDADLLPGWNTRQAQEQPVHPPGQDPKRPWMQVLDAEARIFMFHNFLTDYECDHIMSLAKPHMARSGVVDTSTGGSEISDIRTSKGTFLERGQDEVVAAIEERIARWSLLPVGNGEGLQVLNYQPGQEYQAHWDYFFDKQNGESNGGNRYATVLMYLNDVEEGGETVFPNIPAPGGDNGPTFSECARKHLAAKPRKGSAVLFHSIKPSGEMERRSLHTACPVIRGEKWSAPKWIHVSHYAMGGEVPVAVRQRPQKVGNLFGCEDEAEMCEHWASSGECEKNRVYMVGTRGKPGACVKSCDACLEIFSAAEKPRKDA